MSRAPGEFIPAAEIVDQLSIADHARRVQNITEAEAIIDGAFENLRSTSALSSEEHVSLTAQAHIALGSIHLDNGQLSEAKADFEAAIDLFDNNAQPDEIHSLSHSSLAHYFTLRGQYPLTEAHLKHASRLAPERSLAESSLLNQSGLLHLVQGRPQYAQGQLERALAIAEQLDQTPATLELFTDIYLHSGITSQKLEQSNGNAEELYGKAFETATQISYRKRMFDAQIALTGLYIERGMYQVANTHSSLAWNRARFHTQGRTLLTLPLAINQHLSGKTELAAENLVAFNAAKGDLSNVDLLLLGSLPRVAKSQIPAAQASS